MILDHSLLVFLQDTLNNGQAVAITGFAIDLDAFKTADALGNEKQRIGAVIRRHINHLRDCELIANEKVSINWHPEEVYPQVSYS